MSTVKLYSRLLSAITDNYNNTNFQDYSPSEVIDSFWTDHNWNNNGINLFDLILMARGNKSFRKKSFGEFDKFLDDFSSFMIASHTVHYINRDNGKLGRYLSEQRALDVKEEVRIDFLNRLIGIE